MQEKINKLCARSSKSREQINISCAQFIYSFLYVMCRLRRNVQKDAQQCYHAINTLLLHCSNENCILCIMIKRITRQFCLILIRFHEINHNTNDSYNLFSDLVNKIFFSLCNLVDLVCYIFKRVNECLF